MHEPLVTEHIEQFAVQTVGDLRRLAFLQGDGLGEGLGFEVSLGGFAGV